MPRKTIYEQKTPFLSWLWDPPTWIWHHKMSMKSKQAKLFNNISIQDKFESVWEKAKFMKKRLNDSQGETLDIIFSSVSNWPAHETAAFPVAYYLTFEHCELLNSIIHNSSEYRAYPSPALIVSDQLVRLMTVRKTNCIKIRDERAATETAERARLK